MFFDELGSVSRTFNSISKEKVVKIISHNDADGICASSIFIKMLLGKKRNFELRIIKQLTKEIIDELNLQGKILVLLDCGSGQLNFLENILEEGEVFVLDHHFPINLKHSNLFHLNPMLDGIDDLSASMVTYLFAKAIDLKSDDLVDLAIVGGVDEVEFKEHARKIVEEAEKLGKVKVERGIKLYGRYSRPVHKALEYSFDLFIPGISGSESNAVQFLSEHGIKIKGDDEWRKLSDLNLEEQRKLASAIIIERLRGKEESAEDIFGDNYTLIERPMEIKDAREFATLVNACGRMDRWDVGIRVCLGDREAVKIALSILEDYRRLIAQYLDWVRSEGIKVTENATYVFAGDRIKDTLIAPLVSILLNSNLIERNKPIFGFADSDGKVKISARAAHDVEINLRDVVAWVAERVGGSGGGHLFAAGGLIPKGRERNFMEMVEMRLSKHGSKKD
ncbi:MAG: DHH family phosphoesterase [Candidatus Aenigmarchaeota archaeon]|nr:DHH family phosphoesterase [Candidatus Aenigmarchaeota archaeon]